MSQPPPPPDGSYPQYPPTDPTRIGYPTDQGGPTGYPPTGYPPPAYPPPGGYPAGGYGYPPAPPPRGTNGFAIAALILGILGVLGAIFGFIALSQIKRTGQSGRGLAIAGIVLSGFWAALIVVGIIGAILTSASRDGSGEITGGGTVSATALQVGDCLVDLSSDTEISSVDAVPCATPHEGEVFAVYDLLGLPGAAYPGQPAVQAQVEADCNTRLESYAPSSVGDASIGLYFIYPLASSWSTGDREVVCVATSLSGPTTGSIAG